MRAVIPAAGLGRRFLPVTRVMAKELLPLGRKPLIHHALDEVERAGFESVTIITSAGKGALRTYFEPDRALERRVAECGDGEALARLREAVAVGQRLRLEFVEQSEPAGMGDAVLLAGAAARGEPFAVLTPDDVIPGTEHWARLLQLHERTGRPCVCVRRVPPETAHRFGIAVCSDAGAGDGSLRVERLVEKPAPGQVPSDLAVLGRYIVTAELLGVLERLAAARAPGREVQLTDALAALVDRALPVFAVPFSGVHYDSGTPDEYASAAARYVSAGATEG